MVRKCPLLIFAFFPNFVESFQKLPKLLKKSKGTVELNTKWPFQTHLNVSRPSRQPLAMKYHVIAALYFFLILKKRMLPFCNLLME